MESKLKNIFEFQKFQPNARLQKMINEAERSSRRELSLDDLDWVAAAGTTNRDLPERRVIERDDPDKPV